MCLLGILSFFLNLQVIQINAWFNFLSQIKQSYLIAPHEWHFQIVHHILKEHILQARDYKVNYLAMSEFELLLIYLKVLMGRIALRLLFSV